jgi:cytidine deaminase
MTDKQLIEMAEKARESAYAPYSGFTVGAALLCADGTLYTGCNIENASFTPTCCAERVAVFKAVSEGKRDFVAIAVAGGKAGEQSLGVCAPCGVCRQVLSEFARPDLRVLFSDGTQTTLGGLLPLSFEL